MTRRFVASFARSILVALTVLICGTAAAETLPTVTVWATTSDGFSVLSPLGGRWATHGRPQCYEGVAPGTSGAGGSAGSARTRERGVGINGGGNCQIDPWDYFVEMTKEQFCNAIKNNPPSPNCTRSNFPAAPGMPSASGARWAGNGCGSTPWTTALAAGFLSQELPGLFSGDLNRPVAGNPSIDFALICNEHDANYTRPMTRLDADNKFRDDLAGFCTSSTDPTLCQVFANVYVQAVGRFGQSAYEADQAQLRCSSWGNILRASECS